MLDTIDALLTNCDFEYRQKEKCNLKYKKMLYSNHGLRKLFILMLIDLTQHTTRCSNRSDKSQEDLISGHTAVETEAELIQI